MPHVFPDGQKYIAHEDELSVKEWRRSHEGGAELIELQNRIRSAARTLLSVMPEKNREEQRRRKNMTVHEGHILASSFVLYRECVSAQELQGRAESFHGHRVWFMVTREGIRRQDSGGCAYPLPTEQEKKRWAQCPCPWSVVCGKRGSWWVKDRKQATPVHPPSFSCISFLSAFVARDVKIKLIVSKTQKKSRSIILLVPPSTFHLFPFLQDFLSLILKRKRGMICVV